MTTTSPAATSPRGLRLGAWAALAAAVCFTAAAEAWTPRADEERRQVVEAELGQAFSQVKGELRRQRLDAMAPSIFTFLRGSAGLYHRDLRDNGALDRSEFHLKAMTWLQGDAHVRNVGVFEDDRGDVVFDLDDFDQAWPGSYLVDVWRMASSLEVFAHIVGVSQTGPRAARAFTESYTETVLSFAGNDREKDAQLTRKSARGPARRLIAETRDEEGWKVMVKEWTRGKGEARRFRRLDDLEKLAPSTAAQLIAAVARYAAELDDFDDGYFRTKDVARRLKAGIGSRGVDRFYVLIEGPEGQRDVILDVKAQVEQPPLARLFAAWPAQKLTGGCRVALAEKALLTRADDHLGCLEFGGQSFSVRRRNPYKKSMKAKKIDGAGDLEALARDLGVVLASAHARADRDFPQGGIETSFDDALADALNTERRRRAFIDEVAAWSSGYARQVALDYAFFLDWSRRQ
ncbi:MAG: DUF2252 family protein [Acidobacteriota bacterium]